MRPPSNPRGRLPLSELFATINWTNDPSRIRSPLEDADGNILLVRGVLSLGALFAVVNWSNATQAPDWPRLGGDATARASGPAVEINNVEGFFSAIDWGE